MWQKALAKEDSPLKHQNAKLHKKYFVSMETFYLFLASFRQETKIDFAGKRKSNNRVHNSFQ
ncbi:MAG: hypothetical protein MZV64_52225 [Ignavibacteriales bacterium]|nr:hypothetical protein [Ignavibacteriales bacterium]